MNNPKDRGRCIKCGSKLTYVRLGGIERVCRFCGHVEKIKGKRDK